MTHPRVRAAALVAMPEDRLDERACAYIVAEGEAPDVAELARFLAELGVAKFKWPERVEVVEAFPMTAVGKLAKNVLRADVARKIQQPAAGTLIVRPAAGPR